MSSFHILTYLGPTPCEEECSQAGEDDFARLNRLDCRVFINQLKRCFPIPAELEGKVEYGMQAEQHDFGTYREVVIRGIAWIIHDRLKKGRKESLKRFRIKLSSILSTSIVP